MHKNLVMIGHVVPEIMHAGKHTVTQIDKQARSSQYFATPVDSIGGGLTSYFDIYDLLLSFRLQILSLARISTGKAVQVTK